MKTDLFQSCGHCWVFQICWHIECITFTASSFRIWNSSTGIPSPPLAFLVFGNFLYYNSLPRMGLRPLLFCLFIFYILSCLLSKAMGCFSGHLMSSASDQKLFCGVCSAFKCSFDEFVREKVVSPSYSSTILAPPPAPPPLTSFVVMLRPTWLHIPGCLALDEWSHHRDYLGCEGLFCTVLLCILATSS